MKRTSLYRHFNGEGQLLYVGISLSAIQRLGQHKEHSDWFESITRVTIEQFDTREEALEAERSAIFRERPLHNIQHKHGADEERRKANEKLSATAQAKKDLTARIVYFNPVYTLDGAADALSVSKRLLTLWVREGKIGYFTMPNKTGKPIPYISGWQLIEHIESMLNKSPDRVAEERADIRSKT